MILVIGEILFDLFENEKRLGGASFNFAYHMNKLGFDVRLMTRVGDDACGREIKDFIRKSGLNPEGVQTDPRHDTGAVKVTFDPNGDHSFSITPDVAYDHLDFLPHHKEWIETAELIYFGTLIQRSPPGYARVQEFLEHRGTESVCFCDINLRPRCYTDDVVRASLRCADICKLNDDELSECRRILKVTDENADLVQRMRERFGISAIAVTHGERGSDLFMEDGRYHVDSPSLTTLVDTVGAGDAYAAMLAAGILMKQPPRSILDAASDFASKICGIRGAVPGDDDFYDSAGKWRINGGEHAV